MNRKVEVALTLGRKYGVVPKVVEQYVSTPRMCAVHGKPYVAIYRVLPNGYYKLHGSERVEAGNRASRPARLMEIDINRVVDRIEDKKPCPWCGARDLVHCGSCDTIVCDGRTTGNVFRCHDACGHKGEMAGFFTRMVAAPHILAGALRAPQAPEARRLQPPNNSRLLLGSGKR